MDHTIAIVEWRWHFEEHGSERCSGVRLVRLGLLGDRWVASVCRPTAAPKTRKKEGT